MANYSRTCPRCGDEFAGDDRDAVADAVVAHARGAHQHALGSVRVSATIGATTWETLRVADPT